MKAKKDVLNLVMEAFAVLVQRAGHKALLEDWADIEAPKHPIPTSIGNAIFVDLLERDEEIIFKIEGNEQMYCLGFYYDDWNYLRFSVCNILKVKTKQVIVTVYEKEY